ncbi:DoxX family protein [Lysobacter arvi]|uniref:DoxX family protein n=1 Tax=Lysobacter arvi TaxID=3038776 RepID=A0ABU1CA86_9GAMM|nr:DoxX family protein [Lysobacter arvi]MDR0182035.1 DoxX family protein [Lysobacter arvi]
MSSAPPLRSALPFLARVDGVGQWLSPLGLRVLLAWEFFEAGLEKLHGANWFADLGDKFPLPFSLLSANVNWNAAMWLELAGGIALLIGLGTRYVSAALFVLTVVATYAVHWPADWSGVSELLQGYAITNEGFGNYKLPLIYLVMLVPLMLNGGGRLSLDRLLARWHASPAPSKADATAWGAVLFGIGATVSILLPVAGGALAVAGAGLLAWHRARGSSARPLVNA